MARRIVRAMLATIALAGCGRGTSPTSYLSRDGQYYVAMPGVPKESRMAYKSPDGWLTMQVASGSARDGTTYSVAYVDFSEDAVRAESSVALLHGAARRMADAGHWKLLAQRTIVRDGLPGRDVRFEAPLPGSPEPGAGRLKLYLLDRRLYRLQVVGPASKASPADAEAFFDSFRLLGRPAPGVAAPRPTVLGTPSDPSGDCRIRVNSLAATIDVPGTYHDLAPDSKALNAPRILSNVSGDFDARGKVAGQFRPAKPGTKSFEAAPAVAAGLLVWLTKEECIRLERVAELRDGRVRSLVRLVHYNAWTGPFHAKVVDHAVERPDGPVYLRLRREGDHLAAFLGADGRRWTELKVIAFPWKGASFQVGVAATSTSSAPFSPRFEDYELTRQ